MIPFTNIAADERLHTFTDCRKDRSHQFRYIHDDAIGNNTNHTAEIHKEIVEDQDSCTLIDIPGTKSPAQSHDMNEVPEGRLP